MRFPSIKTISKYLSEINKEIEIGENEEYVDIRLQVSEAGKWTIHVGDSSYDQDHRGYWGCSSLDGKRFRSREMSKDLINQVKEDYYSSQASKG